MSEEQPVQYKHKCLFRWNIGDDAYKPSIAVYEDGMVEIEVGGHGIGTSIEGIFNAMADKPEPPCEASSLEGKEELRPCPFCGRLFDLDEQYTGEEIRCPSCICTLVEKYNEELPQLKERWNSAWCWKEIDRMKSQNESRDAEVESFIPSGWEFDTADFSIRGADGYVCLRRDKKGTEWWHGLSEEDRERTDLYVYGRASSLVQAIKNAVSNVREESK